jgi:hypothetical protein
VGVVGGGIKLSRQILTYDKKYLKAFSTIGGIIYARSGHDI